MGNDLNAATFGEGAHRYAQARPRYPAAMFDWIAQVAPARGLAWDAGCGNGQATIDLAARFDRVIGTDSSKEQIALAPAVAGVEWQVASAETANLPVGAVDAAIAANAFHWFDLARFFPKLQAALSRGGVFVALGYGASVLPPDIQEHVSAAYAVLQPYWADGNRALWRGYRDLPFPLEEIEAPAFAIELSWTATQWLDYTTTWSAYQRYVKETGRDPDPQIADRLIPAWGSGRRLVTMPLTIRAGRRSG